MKLEKIAAQVSARETPPTKSQLYELRKGLKKMIRGNDFWDQVPEEKLKELLKLARLCGAKEEERRIWDALCEKHGHRCDTCRVCTGWKKADYSVTGRRTWK